MFRAIRRTHETSPPDPSSPPRDNHPTASYIALHSHTNYTHSSKPATAAPAMAQRHTFATRNQPRLPPELATNHKRSFQLAAHHRGPAYALRATGAFLRAARDRCLPTTFLRAARHGGLPSYALRATEAFLRAARHFLRKPRRCAPLPESSGYLQVAHL